MAYPTRHSRFASALLLAIASLGCIAGPVSAWDDRYHSLTLEQAFERLQKSGLSILYSTDLIRPWMRVRTEPTGTGPRSILEEILVPFEIAVADGPNGSVMLVRARRSSPPPMSRIVPSPVRAADAAAIAGNVAEVIVTASRYEFVREPSPSVMMLTAGDLQLIPAIGDDPVRAVARLPGAASSDFSAKSSVRGGEVDETLVRFDDLRLYNPFHLKDFQSAFSTIDPRVVSQISIYTGGFPVAFGDRMSSVIDIESLPPAENAYQEISLSTFNASALATGRFNEDDGDWLLSARRGNLDLIFKMFDPRLGQPSYLDVHGRIGHRLAPSLKASANFLVFDDDIVLHDGDDEEDARAGYRDEYYWLRFDYEPGDRLAGDLLLASSSLASERVGRTDKPGVSRGELADRRSFTSHSLQTDWSWRVADELSLQFGAEWRNSAGRYDYRDDVQFDLLFLAPGASLEASRSRQLSERPDGGHYGAYANLRFAPAARLTAEGGLRWDEETLSARNDDQFSPRLSLLYEFGERTRVRASWGRFFQAQAINELQVSDGISEFFPAQRSNHQVMSLDYRHPRGVDIRLEAYRKDYRRLRPRFENLLNSFILLPELKPDRIRVAPDRAAAKGAEISLRKFDEAPLGWWFSYALSSVKDDAGGEDTRRSWDQTHSVSSGVVWRGQPWELSLAAKYHTGWPTTSVSLVQGEALPLVATGPRNAVRLSSYFALDARVARKIDLRSAGTLSVFLEVSNMTNQTNDCCVEHDIDAETGEVELDLERVHSLRVLPSLGFIWQF